MEDVSRLEDAIGACRGLLRASALLRRELDRVMAPAGLSGPQFGILIQLESGGPMPLSELGKRLWVSCGNITGLIDRLVRAGYVRRVGLPDDRRVTIAELTEKGADLMREQRPLHRECMMRFVAQLDDHELRSLREILSNLFPPEHDEPGYPAGHGGG